MNKICTTIEQSRKLLELVIDINTADMCWSIDTPDLPTLLAYPFTDCHRWENKIPCWSLTALLELIPDRLYVNDDEEYWFELDKVGGLYRCYYEEDEFEYDLSFFDGEEPIDVLFNMVVWLKENGKI